MSDTYSITMLLIKWSDQQLKRMVHLRRKNILAKNIKDIKRYVKVFGLSNYFNLCSVKEITEVWIWNNLRGSKHALTLRHVPYE